MLIANPRRVLTRSRILEEVWGFDFPTSGNALEVYAQFDASRDRFRHPDRVHVLGNPLREGIATGSREAALGKFGLDATLKTLVVLGGSQGATTINEAVCDVLEDLGEAGVQIIHQTGLADIDRVSEGYETVSAKSCVAAFFDDMSAVLSAADLILGRAGATTLAEISAAGRASVLVPYPAASDDHQTLNARAFVEAGAVQCGFCTPGMVLATFALLKKNPKPKESEIRHALDGNLCRCTGYVKIIEAVKMAAERMARHG